MADSHHRACFSTRRGRPRGAGATGAAAVRRCTAVRSDSHSSAGRNGDSVKILGFWHFFLSRNPRNLRPETSSLVSTSLTHSEDDEDSEDSGIVSLFFCWNLRNLPTESSSNKTFASCTEPYIGAESALKNLRNALGNSGSQLQTSQVFV